MTEVYLIISLAIPVASGFFIAGWFLGRDSGVGVIERLAAGTGVGLGLTANVLFLEGVAGVPFGASAAAAPVVLVAAAFYLLCRREGSTPFRTAGGGVGEGMGGWRLYAFLILGAWLVAKTAFVFHEGFMRPVFSWDAWNNWSSGAKLFFHSRGLLLDPESGFFFGSGYRFIGHPLTNTLLQVWTALWLGEFHEVFVKGWAALFFVSLLGVFYGAARREARGLAPVVGVSLLATVPLVTYHGTVAYSDLPLAFFALAATSMFWRFMKTGDLRVLALSGVFVSFAALTKNEGLFFILAIGFALVLYLVLERRPLLPALAAFAAPCVVLIGPWFAFKAINGLGFGHSGETAEVKLFHDPNYPEAPREIHWVVLPVIIKDFFLRANYSLIFPFWVLITVFSARDVLTTRVRYMYVVAGSVISMFLAVYLLVEYAAVIESTGLQRNTMTYLPIVAFTCYVLAVRRFLGKNEGS